MRDLMTELKELRLHGMASAWEELVSQGEPPRVSRRLHLLRNWSHYAKATQVFPRSP